MANSKKLDVKDLVLKIVTIFGAVMTFIALAFKFAFQKTTMGKTATKTNLSLNEWFDSITDLDKLGIDGVGAWKAAKVFLIITLVLVAIAAIIAIVKFFFSNKYIDIALAVVSGLVVVSSIVFTICLVVGMNKVADAYSGIAKISFGPHAGAVCIILFSLISGVAGGLLSAQKRFK